MANLRRYDTREEYSTATSIVATSTNRTNSMSTSTLTTTTSDNNLRGSSSSSSSSFPILEGLPLPGSEEYNRLLQYDASELTGDCELLDVVDACRGTGVSREYIGVFKPYDDECKGEFVDGLPVYWNENKLLYMYPIDVYPEDWSIRALRGLVRWRIAKFKTFQDKESCRREEANIYQIDFAADGQPYNYYPTISCFDEFATDFSGFKVSTITVICKDIVVSAPSPGGGGGISGVTPPGGVSSGSNSNGGGGGSSDNLGLIIGIAAAAVLLLLLGAFCYFKKRNGSGMDSSQRKKKKAAEKKAKEEAKLAAKKKAEAEKKAKEEAKLAAKKKEEEEKQRKKWEKTSDTSTEKTSSKLSKDGPPEIIPIPTRAVPPPSPLPLGRKMSTDPPARITTGSLGPDDDGIPDDIQRMVSDLDNLLDEELKNSVVPAKKHRERTRSLERGRSSNFDADRKNDNGRSRSLERARATAMDYFDRSTEVMANAYDGLKKKAKSLHDKKGDDNDSIDSSIDDFGEDRPSTSRSRGRSLERPGSDDRRERVDRSVERATADIYSRDRTRSSGRSRSKERSRADDYDSRGRGRSKERSGASDYPSSRDRSRSAERARASDYSSRDRSRSAERSRANDYSSRGRSRSAERSKANDYSSRDRSRSAERSKANDYSSRGRSRSKERSAATDHAAHPLRDRGRSRSKERSNSTDYLRDRARARSRSAERNKADDFASRDRGRSRSKERSNSDNYARNRDRSRSIEKHLPRSLEHRRSLEPAGTTADQQPQRKGGWGVPGTGDDTMIGRSKASGTGGGKTLDASKVNETITKNPDGSVLVSKRRRREDGAMVTTKTKYANIALARKHGVDV